MLTWDDLADYEKAALAYCAPHGIPLSVFVGRVVGAGDPQWLERDAQAAVLWQFEQDTRCKGCGRPRSECQVPAGVAPDYEVTVTRCHACESKDAKLAELREDGTSFSGLYVSVGLKED